MAKKQQEETIFTPVGQKTSSNGKMDKAVELPDPTGKSYKDLGLTKKDMIDMYRSMYEQRRFE